jgi:hypothetical protein
MLTEETRDRRGNVDADGGMTDGGRAPRPGKLENWKQIIGYPNPVTRCSPRFSAVSASRR